MASVTEIVVGANATRARTHNRRLVLNRLRAVGQVGRAEIARATGLTTQAVSNIIAELLDDGLIEERGRRSLGRGQPAVLYGLKAEGGYALGMEVRTDAVFAALLDLTGTTVTVRRVPLTSVDRDTVTASVERLLDTILSQTGIPSDKLLGAGIVMPGPFGPTGIRGSASDLAVWGDIDPERHLSRTLGLPVIVENDANAAAVAEHISGVARDLQSFAFLYFGNGLGLGVVQNGRLMRGAFGNAGEIGHIPVPVGEGAASLESVVSRLSLRAALAEADLTAVSSEDLARLHAARAPALERWLEGAAAPLSAAVTIVENLFDPEAVILGGAMPDSLLDRLIDLVALSPGSVSNRSDRSAPRLLRGASGRTTATFGAAALVINRAFTPTIADEQGPRPC